MRSLVGSLVLGLIAALVGTTEPAAAAQVCGCRRNTTGRINRITWGAVPTCPASRTLVCWNDETSSGTVTSITAGNGLDATPNPITGTGTIFVDAPTCSAPSEKLQWDGAAFQCGADQGSVDISVRVYNSSPISTLNGQVQRLTFNAERWDTDSMHSTSTDTDRLTANASGKYLIYGHVSFVSNASGTREVVIRVSDPNGPNGLTEIANVFVPAAPTNVTRLSIATHYLLNQGDYVILDVLQDSGGSLDIQASSNISPDFGMVKLP